MNYGYNNGIMEQKNGPRSSYIFVNKEKDAPQKSGERLCLCFFRLWCQKHDFYNNLLSSTEQRQERHIPLLLMSMCLEQRTIKSTVDNGGFLMCPADHMNAFSRPVDGNCRTNAQSLSGSLLVPFKSGDQTLEYFARAFQHFSARCSLIQDPGERDVCWGSFGRAPGVDCAGWRKKRGTVSPENDGWLTRFLEVPTLWQSVK